MLERFKVPEEDRVYIRPEQMRAATEIVFKNSGLSDEDAGLSTDVLMLSDMRGCETHGVSNMLRRYVEWYDDGLLNPTPNMKIIRESDATATLDADNGLGLHIAPKAMEIAIEKAEKYGMGSVAVSGNNN
ncbi:MAG: Ldh family oxidoreductase, partial [Chloroflexi bacterium]|nr:Ldh family oxidoreductase [Chloroflexota bacterium]